MQQPLTIDQVRQRTPSVYAVEPWPCVSAKYSFLSSAVVLDALAKENIVPYSAKQGRVRDLDRTAYTKHVLRFRPLEYKQNVKIVGDVYPEIVLTNSHDRASCFALDLGLFRLVCLNGMMTAAGVFNSFRVRHMGATIDNVIEATYKIIDDFPRLLDSVERSKMVPMNRIRNIEYAMKAQAIRWPDSAKANEPQTLLL